jgi:hypothetical protein
MWLYMLPSSHSLIGSLVDRRLRHALLHFQLLRRAAFDRLSVEQLHARMQLGADSLLDWNSSSCPQVNTISTSF